MNSNPSSNPPTYCRGVRGAITAEANTPEAILAATCELLTAMIAANQIDPADVGSVIMTTTVDLNAEYPAAAARKLGWVDVAILCAHEIAVPRGLGKCIRILLLWNTPRTAQEIQHVYIGAAQALRPDRARQTLA